MSARSLVSHWVFRSELASLCVFIGFIHSVVSTDSCGMTGWEVQAVASAGPGLGGLVTTHPTAPADLRATNSTGSPGAPKFFTWRSSWEGWNGLHLELTLTRMTLLGLVAPGVTNLERLNLPKVVDEQISGRNPALETNVHGLYLGRVKMAAKVGGKLAVDGAGFMSDPGFDKFDAGAEVRRVRLYAKGDCLLVLPVYYEVEAGYIPDEFYLEHSYLARKDLPALGELKLGQFQAPMSLDGVASSRDITFMELAAPVQALAPGVDAGLQVGRPILNQRMTWAAGVFSQGVGRDYGDASENYARVIARLTGLPRYELNPEQPNSTRLLHLGLSANVLYTASSSVRYQTRPESHLAPYVVDTGVLSADGALVSGAEAAFVNGPFSIQAEYLHSWVNENNGELPNFYGFYGSASWFLTGETRPYDRQNGCFTRVIPRRNFDWGKGGWGAWEVGARYSFVNLSDEDVHGGRLSMLMAGINWYLHPHVKWRLDYGFGHVSNRQPAGDFQMLQTRLELDF